MAGYSPLSQALGRGHPELLDLSVEDRRRVMKLLQEFLDQLKCLKAHTEKARRTRADLLDWASRHLPELVAMLRGGSGRRRTERCALAITCGPFGETLDGRFILRVHVLRWPPGDKGPRGMEGPGPGPRTLEVPLTKHRRAVLDALAAEGGVDPSADSPGSEAAGPDAPRLVGFKRRDEAVRHMREHSRIHITPHAYTEAVRKLTTHLRRFGLGWLIEIDRRYGARARVLRAPRPAGH